MLDEQDTGPAIIGGYEDALHPEGVRKAGKMADTTLSPKQIVA